jgi:hypothetical protein
VRKAKQYQLPTFSDCTRKHKLHHRHQRNMCFVDELLLDTQLLLIGTSVVIHNNSNNNDLIRLICRAFKCIFPRVLTASSIAS